MRNDKKDIDEVSKIVSQTIDRIAAQGGNVVDIIRAATQLGVVGITTLCESEEEAMRYYDNWLVSLLKFDDEMRLVISETYDEVSRN